MYSIFNGHDKCMRTGRQVHCGEGEPLLLFVQHPVLRKERHKRPAIHRVPAIADVGRLITRLEAHGRFEPTHLHRSARERGRRMIDRERHTQPIGLTDLAGLVSRGVSCHHLEFVPAVREGSGVEIDELVRQIDLEHTP